MCNLRSMVHPNFQDQSQIAAFGVELVSVCSWNTFYANDVAAHFLAAEFAPQPLRLYMNICYSEEHLRARPEAQNKPESIGPKQTSLDIIIQY